MALALLDEAAAHCVRDQIKSLLTSSHWTALLGPANVSVL